MTSRDHLETAGRDMLRIVDDAGLPPPDEINHHVDDGEVELIWREQKLVVIVECGPECAE
jgi:hypothetical protein